MRFDAATPRARRTSILATIGATVIRHLPVIDYDLVRLPAALDVVAAVEALRRAPGVAVAEPNWKGSVALSAPNDRCFAGCTVNNQATAQWNLPAVNAVAGWSLVPGRFYTSTQKLEAAPVKVAVLDTKIERTMSDWANAGAGATNPFDAANGGQLDIADAKDFVPVNNQQGPAYYHGTFIAGIIGASANNGLDIAGLGYRAQIMPLTVVDGDGVTDAAALAEAIVWAASKGARVINMSLVLEAETAAVQEAVNAAKAMGALSVAAAGNNVQDFATYPAHYDNVMSVTAIDNADRPGICSGYSDRTSVAAPGVAILSLDTRASGTGSLGVTPCGTSTAAPHVSGLAALLFAQQPSRTPEQVRAIIERTADDDRFNQGFDQRFGNGRINVERALRDGDGAPVLDRVRASVPAAFGGVSTITATSAAVAATAVLDAEYFIDTIGAPGTGGQVSAADGAFDERQENLNVQISVPVTGVNAIATGVHRLYMRAYDGAAWGASSVGVLIVDRAAPKVEGLVVSPIATPQQVATIRFNMSDDYAATLTYFFTVTRQGVGGQPVYTSPLIQRPGSATPTQVSTTWTPGLTDVGAMNITVSVVDEAGNRTQSTAGTIAL